MTGNVGDPCGPGRFVSPVRTTIDGVVHVAGPGLVAIVPANVRHAVKALTDGRVIIVDHPARPELG